MAVESVAPEPLGLGERRLSSRVFLSSTFTDLADYRNAVQAAIRQLGAVDVSMENFGARDERPLDECVRLVRQQSDIFVGIYAHKYGFMPDGQDVSISEAEYRAASEIPLPRFIYMVDENHPWPPPHIERGASQERLQNFKANLRKHHICQTFATADQLATKVVADIGRHLSIQRTPKIDPTAQQFNPVVLEAANPSEGGSEWHRRRSGIYDRNRNVFMTHVIQPSSKPGQLFDASI